ncbi:MAG: glycosyltransferase family 2 protein [Synergistaceae bacterium]|nr:glycosyltransferase family 2 protein [Synergistaceae bacterium]
MNDLVSVIIPAYNAASRIRYTLESIAAQDYGDIEIILVDDASKDETGKIAREVLDASGRSYRIITHSLNRGECASRNTGIDAANGRYVCFIDADDLVRGNFVSRLHDAVSAGECDISFCGLTDRFTDGQPDRDIPPKLSGQGEELILTRSVPPVWCCMYDAGFLRRCGLKFYEGCTAGGDVEFITKALCRAGKIAAVNECLYVYMHHEAMGSVRDNDTRDKKILRYSHNTGAQVRTAEYLAGHSSSPELRDMAGKILLPQGVIRRLTLAAMKDDRKEYDAILEDSEIRKTLRKALGVYTLIRRPEIFVKALMIMMMPGIYYSVRKR